MQNMIWTKNKAVIIDDDRSVGLVLQNYLFSLETGIQVLKTYTDPVQALEEIALLRPDILFVDIMMPRMSGLELVKQAEKIKDFDIIFITSSTNHALEAFEFNVIDYLTKPLTPEKVLRLLEKLHKRRNLPESSSVGTIGGFKNDFKSSIQDDPIAQTLILEVPTKKGSKIIDANDLVHLEANGPYTHLFSKTGESFIVSKHIGHFDELFNNLNFFRIHRSTLVNAIHITELLMEEGHYFVVTSIGAKLIVSERKMKPFKTFYLDYLQNKRI